jgi:hypothetical protein
MGINYINFLFNEFPAKGGCTYGAEPLSSACPATMRRVEQAHLVARIPKNIVASLLIFREKAEVIPLYDTRACL